jgi:magnesium transporter
MEALTTSRELFDYRAHPPGTMPGLIEIAANAQPTEIEIINYSPQEYSRLSHLAPEECAPYLKTPEVSWIDVSGLGSEDILERLREVFELDRLVLEDVVQAPQRPKIEDHPNQLLIITQMVIPKPKKSGFWQEQVGFILGENYLLTVQEEAERDSFELVRERIRLNKGIIRQRGADYLLYSLWDTIIDTYFQVLEDYRERLEILEEEIIFSPSEASLGKIYHLKRELIALRRGIWPQRDALNSIDKGEHDWLSEEVCRYLRDCYDHAVQIIDLIEVYSELLGELMNVYLSAIANKTNEVMKVLTVISTIFIPLTFIAGIYGMNFNPEKSPYNMPELEWYWGYAFAWGIMLVIAGSLVFYFWRKGWFKSQGIDKKLLKKIQIAEGISEKK